MPHKLISQGLGQAGAWSLLALVLGGVISCRPAVTIPADNHTAYPPDFALVFTVTGSRDADAGRDPEPRRRSAQHVLAPDRLLRVALGPGVRADLYPPPTANISIPQMALLYRLATAARQTAEEDNQPLLNPPRSDSPAPPTVASTGPITYRLTLTADDQRWTYETPPRENAAATALLDELIRLRGGS